MGFVSVLLGGVDNVSALSEHILFTTDGVFDIGSPDGGTTQNRPKSIFVSREVQIGDSSLFGAGGFSFPNSLLIGSGPDVFAFITGTTFGFKRSTGPTPLDITTLSQFGAAFVPPEADPLDWFLFRFDDGDSASTPLIRFSNKTGVGGGDIELGFRRHPNAAASTGGDLLNTKATEFKDQASDPPSPPSGRTKIFYKLGVLSQKTSLGVTTPIAGSPTGTANRAAEFDGGGSLVASSITTLELSQLSGVASNIQTQLNAKSTASKVETLTNKTFDADAAGNSITNIENSDIKIGANISLAKLAGLPAGNRALASNGSGVITESLTTLAQLEFSKNVTSDVQSQIDSKISSAKIAYQLVNADVDVANTAFILTGNQVWDQSRHSGYSNPVLLYGVEASPNRDMELRIFDRDTATQLALVTITQGSGTVRASLSFTAPVADTVLEVQVQKTSAGGTNPTFEAAAFEYDQ